MNVLLVRYGEIHLKGQNRPVFERLLLNEIKRAVGDIAKTIIKMQGRFYVEDYKSENEQEIIEKIQKVFGVHSISIARKIPKEWDTIVNTAIELISHQSEISDKKILKFKVIARRSDKTFEKSSMEMAPLLGGLILENVPNTQVDVRNYDVALGVEIREFAYLYTGEIYGQGGMPLGGNGKAMLLLSGGIDSPVAGHMIMKRGVKLECVHFNSPPYTSERALHKVQQLAKILSQYCGSVRLHVVEFTQIQQQIHKLCPERETTVIMRRGMMEIAQIIAEKTHCQALVTGEAIGQVASQTIDALFCTNEGIQMPIFRPLIGFDKNEILERSRNIGAYETSILPFEDCCTIFTPKHPATMPKIEKIKESQALIPNWKELIEQAAENATREYISEK